MRVLLISANRERLPQPVVPLGLLLVASSLEDAHDVSLLDLCFEEDPLAAVARAIDEVRPEVVGVGLRNLHTNAYDGTEQLVAGYAALVAAVRARTRAPVVLGGSGFSLRPETLLAQLGADHGVVGEGERAFRALVDALAAGQTPPRLMYGEAAAPIARGLVRREAARSDLDLLPTAARRLVDRRYYEHDGTDNIQTKRGCAFTCAYCDYPDLEGRKVRLRSPEAVADEVLARSKDPGVSHIFFVDSVFNVPRSHALHICDALVARGTPLPWVCYGSPVSFDDELVKAMARAGCQGVEIGSDTGTERMLERLQKPFGLADIVATRKRFVEHGILDCHTFVLGALDETADEVRATLDFIDQLGPDLAVFIVFMEDRESMTVHRARHRDAILELLAREAPRRPGWVVPELSIRFGARLDRLLARRRLRGPSWLHLARLNREARTLLAERAMATADIFRLVGQIIEHRYRVDSVVGEGGFGVVYRGWHLAFQRPVAIKCLKIPAHFTDDARRVFIDRFREEATLLARLNERCPHVVRVLDVGVLEHDATRSLPYLALEWLDGKNLREAIDAWRAAGLLPLDEGAAVALLAPVIQALASAHQGDAGASVAHRDVKPENLFVLAAGGIKLLDFGIAKVMQEGERVTLAQSQTSSGFSSFSPSYGAPEQFNAARFGQTGPWTDVHALGLVLAELVADRRPLGQGDYPGCFAASQAPERPTPRRLGARVSDAFEALCTSALALDPRHRFPDAVSLLAALDPWLRAGSLPPRLASSPAPHHVSASATTAAAAGSSPAVATGFALGTFALHPALSAPPRSPAAPATSATPATPATPATQLALATLAGSPGTPPAPSFSATATTAATAPTSAPTASATSPARSRRGATLVLGLLALVAAAGTAAGLLGGVFSSPTSTASAVASIAPSAPASAAASAPAPRRPPASPSARATAGARLSRMILVPGGTLTVATPRQAPRKTTVASFLIDEIETTVEAYAQCVDAGACTTEQLRWLPGCHWENPDKLRHSINCVSPIQAEEFCRWADRRLPTEEEWELAARGAEGRPFPWGTAAPAGQICWNGPGNEIGQGYRKEGCPAGASALDVTPLGVRDLGGNLSEWTASPFCDFLGEDRAACARMSCSFRADRVCQERRVQRGGSWGANSPSSLRGESRSSGILGRSTDGTGFRCARTP